jgi:hypothetical protein
MGIEGWRRKAKDRDRRPRLTKGYSASVHDDDDDDDDSMCKLYIVQSPSKCFIIYKFYHQLIIKSVSICFDIFQLRIAAIFKNLQLSRHIQRATEVDKYNW